MAGLSMNEWHHVTQANHCFFPNGMVHPDRIMEDYDLIYMVDGEWEIYQEGQPYLLQKNEVMLLTAGKHHYGFDKCREHTRTMYLHFSSFPDEAEECDGSRQEDGIRLEPILPCDPYLPVKTLFEEIIHLYWSADEHKDIIMAAKLKILLWHLSRQGQVQRSKDHSLDAVLELLTKDHTAFYTIEELASHVNMSPRDLTRKFKLATAQTIHQYQMNLKLEMAAAEITNYPGVTFKEIACAYGFYDEFHFSRCFKNKYGYSPKELKRG